ncbi:MAG: hypothetical protein HRT87_01635 [Legionellales bacterium]|nr:hypothetical protein [Legionellales bacterium]
MKTNSIADSRQKKHKILSSIIQDDMFDFLYHEYPACFSKKYIQLRESFLKGKTRDFNDGLNKIIADNHNNLNNHLKFAAKILSLFRGQEKDTDFGYEKESNLIWHLALHTRIAKKLLKIIEIKYKLENLCFDMEYIIRVTNRGFATTDILKSNNISRKTLVIGKLLRILNVFCQNPKIVEYLEGQLALRYTHPFEMDIDFSTKPLKIKDAVEWFNQISVSNKNTTLRLYSIDKHHLLVMHHLYIEWKNSNFKHRDMGRYFEEYKNILTGLYFFHSKSDTLVKKLAFMPISIVEKDLFELLSNKDINANHPKSYDSFKKLCEFLKKPEINNFLLENINIVNSKKYIIQQRGNHHDFFDFKLIDSSDFLRQNNITLIDIINTSSIDNNKTACYFFVFNDAVAANVCDVRLFKIVSLIIARAGHLDNRFLTTKFIGALDDRFKNVIDNFVIEKLGFIYS